VTSRVSRLFIFIVRALKRLRRVPRSFWRGKKKIWNVFVGEGSRPDVSTLLAPAGGGTSCFARAGVLTRMTAVGCSLSVRWLSGGGFMILFWDAGLQRRCHLHAECPEGGDGQRGEIRPSSITAEALLLHRQATEKKGGDLI
jgi:hypothetical protein